MAMRPFFSVRATAWVSMAAAWALLAAPVAAGPATPDWDDWYITSMMGAPVGWQRVTVGAATWKGQKAVRCAVSQVVVIRRGPIALRIESESQSYMTEGFGEPLAFVAQRVEGGEVTRVEGVVEGDTLTVTTDTKGRPHVSKVKGVKGKLLGACSGPAWIGVRKHVAGERVQLPVIVEETGSLENAEISITRVDGDGIQMRMTIMGAASDELDEPSGRLVRATINDGLMTVTRTTKAEAVAALARIESGEGTDADPFAAGAAPDLFTPSLLTLDRPLPTGFVRSFAVELEATKGAGVELPTTARQVVQRRGKTTSVRIKADQRAEAAGAQGGAALQAELQAALAPTPFAQSDDPKIVAIADTIVKGLSPTDAAGRIRAVTGHVHNYIVHKNLGTGMASALTVIETRSGDCTEHAVLAVALLQAARVPARLAYGLVHLNGILGYHEWAEAYDGRGWLAIDPTFNQVPADATHIQFGWGQADMRALTMQGTTIATTLFNLKARVIAAE
jgi:transglutaminase-like putative cysteine protease